MKLILETHKLNPHKPVVGGLNYISARENMSLVSQCLINNINNIILLKALRAGRISFAVEDFAWVIKYIFQASNGSCII